MALSFSHNTSHLYLISSIPQCSYSTNSKSLHFDLCYFEVAIFASTQNLMRKQELLLTSEVSIGRCVSLACQHFRFSCDTCTVSLFLPSQYMRNDNLQENISHLLIKLSITSNQSINQSKMWCKSSLMSYLQMICPILP